MYTSTFDQKSLSEQIYKADFKKSPNLQSDQYRTQILSMAENIAKAGIPEKPLLQLNRAGRVVYQINDLPTNLVLRKAARNIRVLLKIKQGNRHEIIRRIKLLCAEEHPYKLARLDVRRFYESIDQKGLLELVKRRLKTTPSTCFVVKSLLKECNDQGITGVPAGVAVSAQLAELYLSDFDRNVISELSPYYYARYVDDIVMILPDKTNMVAIKEVAEELLPLNLKFGDQKCKVIDIPWLKHASNTIDKKFNYLGFEFTIKKIAIANNNKTMKREVQLDIAATKIRKRKTRLVKSILQFGHDGNFVDLRDRIRIITCNYKFFDRRDGMIRSAGLRHSYGLIDLPAMSIEDLDEFRLKLICSKTFMKGRNNQLSLRQKRELVKLSFRDGFQKDIRYNFAPDRLTELMECWKYA